MRGLILTIMAVSLLSVAGGAVFAQTAAPAAPAPTVSTPPPPAGTSPANRPHGMRPVPSILPTLRLIDSGMLPTLGYLLNLTDDQKTKAQDLLSRTDEELKPKIAAQVKAASDYVALLGNPNSSQADLIAAAQKVLAADSDLMAGRIKAFVAFKALLTPEQNKLLAQELQTTASRWLPQAQAPAGPAAAPAASK